MRDRDQQEFGGVHEVSNVSGRELRLLYLQRPVTLLRLDLDDDAVFCWAIRVDNGDAVNDGVTGHSKLIEQFKNCPDLTRYGWVDARQGEKVEGELYPRDVLEVDRHHSAYVHRPAGYGAYQVDQFDLCRVPQQGALADQSDRIPA